MFMPMGFGFGYGAMMPGMYSTPARGYMPMQPQTPQPTMDQRAANARANANYGIGTRQIPGQAQQPGMMERFASMQAPAASPGGPMRDFMAKYHPGHASPQQARERQIQAARNQLNPQTPQQQQMQGLMDQMSALQTQMQNYQAQPQQSAQPQPQQPAAMPHQSRGFGGPFSAFNAYNPFAGFGFGGGGPWSNFRPRTQMNPWQSFRFPSAGQIGFRP